MTMSLATNAITVLAALGLLAAGPAMAQSAADQPASGTGGGRTSGTQKASDIRDEELREYARIYDQVNDDPGLQRALQNGDLAGKEQSVSTALATAGSTLSVEEFERVHRAVQSDPRLQARVQQEMGDGSTSGSRNQTVRPGRGAPLPSGALGIGPSTVTGGTPSDTRQPGVGVGAPAVSGSESSSDR